MIDGTYKINVEVLFIRKKGTVVLRAEEEKMFADIDAPVIGKQKIEGHVTGEDAFAAQGSGKVNLLGNIDYDLEGRIEGDSIFISIHSNKGEIQLNGRRA